MAYEVKLSYFNSSGKEYGGGKYISNHKKMFEIVEEVGQKHCTLSLPSMGYEDHKFYVLIDVPSHPANKRQILKPTAHKPQIV